MTSTQIKSLASHQRKRMRLRLALCACATLVSCLAAGCVSEKQVKKPTIRSEGGGGKIDEVNVLAVPVALNLDQTPGPDGFVIKVYAGSHTRPKPFAIEDGKIDVIMYDGVPGVTEGASPQPRGTWTYSVEQLKDFEVHTSIGTAYQLAVDWGKNKPTHDKIAVVVIYTPAKGRSIRSAPSVIATR